MPTEHYHLFRKDRQPLCGDTKSATFRARLDAQTTMDEMGEPAGTLQIVPCACAEHQDRRGFFEKIMDPDSFGDWFN